MSSLSHEPLPAVDYYRIVRGQIEHEDNLIGLRLNWFLASQSFLFTAYAIVLSNLHGGGLPAGGPEDSRLLVLRALPAIAIISAALILFTVIDGLLAMNNLRRLLRAYLPDADARGFPPIQGANYTRILGAIAPICLPVVFGTAWLVILYKGR